MKQRSHAWIAVRALALLADAEKSKEVKNLVRLLDPHAKSAAIGAWIPDMQESKRGGGMVSNHTFKLAPYTPRKGKDESARFTVTAKELSKKLGPSRAMADLVCGSAVLNSEWWSAPYKADPPPGQHLADRAMALSTMLVDLLLMGDDTIDKLSSAGIDIPGIGRATETRPEQAATYFFMLSHFVADACMPCHCDDRVLSSFTQGKLHKELEQHWVDGTDELFDASLSKKRMSSKEILKRAKDVDKKFGLAFADEVPELRNKDVWEEIVHICRGSFALASIIAPNSEYGYGSKKIVKFLEAFGGKDGEKLLAEVDKAVLHDAVLNTAMVWKHTWLKFAESSKRGKKASSH